jgi:hypothetical protein
VVAWIRENDEWNLLIGTPLIEKVGERDTFQRLREAFSTKRPVGISNLPVDIPWQPKPSGAGYYATGFKSRALRRATGSAVTLGTA